MKYDTTNSQIQSKASKSYLDTTRENKKYKTISKELLSAILKTEINSIGAQFMDNITITEIKGF